MAAKGNSDFICDNMSHKNIVVQDGTTIKGIFQKN